MTECVHLLVAHWRHITHTHIHTSAICTFMTNHTHSLFAIVDIYHTFVLAHYTHPFVAHYRQLTHPLMSHCSQIIHICYLQIDDRLHTCYWYIDDKSTHIYYWHIVDIYHTAVFGYWWLIHTVVIGTSMTNIIHTHTPVSDALKPYDLFPLVAH